MGVMSYHSVLPKAQSPLKTRHVVAKKPALTATIKLAMGHTQRIGASIVCQTNRDSHMTR
jgi:hypothetical protein